MASPALPDQQDWLQDAIMPTIFHHHVLPHLSPKAICRLACTCKSATALVAAQTHVWQAQAASMCEISQPSHLSHHSHPALLLRTPAALLRALDMRDRVPANMLAGRCSKSVLMSGKALCHTPSPDGRHAAVCSWKFPDARESDRRAAAPDAWALHRILGCGRAEKLQMKGVIAGACALADGECAEVKWNQDGSVVRAVRIAVHDRAGSRDFCLWIADVDARTGQTLRGCKQSLRGTVRVSGCSGLSMSCHGRYAHVLVDTGNKARVQLFFDLDRCLAPRNDGLVLTESCHQRYGEAPLALWHPSHDARVTVGQDGRAWRGRRGYMLRVWDLSSVKVLHELAWPEHRRYGWVFLLAWDASGDKIALVTGREPLEHWYRPDIAVYSLAAASFVLECTSPLSFESEYLRAQFSRGGCLALRDGCYGNMYIWDAVCERWLEVHALASLPGVDSRHSTCMLWSRIGEYLAVVDTHLGNMVFFDAEASRVSACISLPVTGIPKASLAWDAWGASLYCSGLQGPLLPPPADVSSPGLCRSSSALQGKPVDQTNATAEIRSFQWPRTQVLAKVDFAC